MNRPNRYFSRDAFDTPIVSFDRLKSFYQDRDWMEERICDLEADLRAMAPLKPVAAVNYIRKAIGYDDYLRSYAEFRRMKPEELFETADKLAESAAEFATFVEWKEHAARYEEELKKQNQEEREETKDRVTLSTMHSAKGLEFSHVYLAGMEDGIFPSYMTITGDVPSELEEERRLCYVGITRAMQHLTLTCARQRMIRGEVQYNKMSRFVKEIPRELIFLERERGEIEDRKPKMDIPTRGSVYAAMKQAFREKPQQAKTFSAQKATKLDYEIGDTVRHIKFGVGIVTDIVDGGRDYEVTVNFDQAGTKKMFASFAKLKKL